jgi:hypothetical protein
MHKHVNVNPFQGPRCSYAWAKVSDSSSSTPRPFKCTYESHANEVMLWSCTTVSQLCTGALDRPTNLDCCSLVLRARLIQISCHFRLGVGKPTAHSGASNPVALRPVLFPCSPFTGIHIFMGRSSSARFWDHRLFHR